MSDGPNQTWLERQAQLGRIGSAGRKSESRVAKKLGGRLTAASGAKAHSKGDMRLTVGERKFRIEAKSTQNATLPVESHWLKKIMGEAADAGATPALTMTFTDSQGRPDGHTWVAIPLYAFQELTATAKAPDA